MIEAEDFKAESDNIFTLLEDLSNDDFEKVTLFKKWTINDVLRHLHLWNHAAELSLEDPEGFQAFVTQAMTKLMSGAGHQQLQIDMLDGLSGKGLLETWRNAYPTTAQKFSQTDPDARLKWVGPDMSARSCIIARQMENWAHAQAIFDVLGVERENADRLKNVAHIGVTTYSWSYKVNGLSPIQPKPFVELTAPSGAVWTWNAPQDENKLSGDAVEFCQVVTQCRNIGDTSLVKVGEAAKKWMEIAQCFAGGAEKPPAKGQRYKS